ncbi:MAG TPA: deoxyguanosinetriphosphate triphosphohydrolase [Clostridia bacterium]|nr:deoxyguanosinetriphosphate triphosphohydrolase [Clostridia bacterium]
MTIREKTEAIEKETLSPLATLSSEAVREHPMEQCAIRTAFGRDRDRILHSKAFRRLKHKTQVFLSPEGDHYRTRLTHTLEVSQIARTVARALRLNEDLTEAIALGHDLGHTPYGHAGEYALNECCPHGFRHAEQSVRVVRLLENDGKGLNLTTDVLDGIACHTGGTDAKTLEGRVVRYADKIAYMNHDFEDAARAGIIGENDIPWQVKYAIGRSKSERINSFVQSLVDNSGEDIRMAPSVQQAFNTLRSFMFEAVYKNPLAKGEETKAIAMLQGLYKHFVAHSEQLPPEYRAMLEATDVDRVVCDYISGMSDGYAVNSYQSIFVPRSWGF